MKKALLIVLSFLMAIPLIHARDKDEDYRVVVKNDNGIFSFDSVVNVDGVQKEEMFSRAKQWVISNLKTADNNVLFDADKLSIATSSTIVLKAMRGFNWAVTSGFVNFKLNIQFKDNRYRFVFDNIIVQASYADGITETLNYEQLTRNNKVSKAIRQDVNEKLLALSNQLEQAIKTGNNSSSKDDNW